MNVYFRRNTSFSIIDLDLCFNFDFNRSLRQTPFDASLWRLTQDKLLAYLRLVVSGRLELPTSTLSV